MSTVSDSPARDDRIDPFEFRDLRDALPAYAGLVGVFIAGWIDSVLGVALVLAAAVALTVGVERYMQSGQRGEARRAARLRLRRALDDTERKARWLASVLPIAVAFAIALIEGDGVMDGRVLSVATVGGFALSQLVFALWLNATRSRRARGA